MSKNIKISKTQIQELVDRGLITDELVKKGVELGLISGTMKTGRRKVMNSKDEWVEPVLSFKGNGSTPYSSSMEKIRTGFNELLDKYTTVITE